jgi:ATP-dependent exoDNAse (exonuclease V) alpha subunit
LQTELNSNPAVTNSPFRVGDKIVNTKNGFFPSIDYDPADPETATNDRGEVYVANGELAEVLEVDEKLVIARIDSPRRTIKIPRGKQQEASESEAGDPISGDENTPATGCSWDLGYALSVHKSQGSEWPTVVVMLDNSAGAKMVCDRAWLYTAISRAKDKCVLVGRKSTAERFCRFNKMHHRKTLLKERILLEQASRELGDL